MEEWPARCVEVVAVETALSLSHPFFSDSMCIFAALVYIYIFFKSVGF